MNYSNSLFIKTIILVKVEFIGLVSALLHIRRGGYGGNKNN